ncbi:ImmA/IrrE family metallo-endopeptidase [Clostridioides difficile]|uniref:ImmA/IrrE family metallo-endopeptidase n=1 Tax=Clostridioides difficile TaxID=1496 RepID=UPI0013EF8EB8|nr:ImmA/IrrE family metallo-endopeptidase [Clostridioides difficile]HCQ6056237.1 ImmA/IrrE family metallo-endopeptidase [Clostridioides difficile]
MKVYSYDEFAKLIRKDIDFITEKYDKQGFVFWSKRDNTFVICYNKCYPFHSVRWTLMHELSHIFLGHATKTNVLKLHSKSNKLFEVEAEAFTKHILCPNVVLLHCKILEISEIMYFCGVDEDIALKKSISLKKEKNSITNLENLVIKQFNTFIKNYIKHRNKGT